MNKQESFTPLPPELTGSVYDYRSPKGPDLLDRLQHSYAWTNLRKRHDLDPYSRSLQAAPRPSTPIKDSSGRPHEGVNYASQDYLSLSAHPVIREAAIAALDTYGVHSAGSSALLGNTALSLALEAELADILCCCETLLYPTGWAAGFGVIQGLIRSEDHVVLDALAHACLHCGAQAATANRHLFRHNDLNYLEKKLKAIRERDATNAVLVAIEGLYSMESDTPDIPATQALCHRYGATLLVDIAHDFGAIGPGGTGALGEQDMLGKVDLVMGSFSKTFASNGGFVASNHPALKIYLKFHSNPQTFSNALSPIQAAVVRAALAIVRGPEGETRRNRLENAAGALRNAMVENGFSCLGRVSPIVPVMVGNETLIRLTAGPLVKVGVLANVVEYPAVARGQARYRFQVMADHSEANAKTAAAGMLAAVAEANKKLAEMTGANQPPSLL